jgi:hypothetical protein
MSVSISTFSCAEIVLADSVLFVSFDWYYQAQVVG